MRTRSNYALRLPTSLKRAVEEVAREDGTTLNQSGCRVLLPTGPVAGMLNPP